MLRHRHLEDNGRCFPDHVCWGIDFLKSVVDGVKWTAVIPLLQGVAKVTMLLYFNDTKNNEDWKARQIATKVETLEFIFSIYNIAKVYIIKQQLSTLFIKFKLYFAT